MADTSRFKKIIEPWFRNKYLKSLHPNAKIRQDKLGLTWGGQFEYDAVVYENGEIKEIYLLSCSEYKTKKGNGGAGKYHKIKADILMMLGTNAPKKIMAFLGESMYQQFKKQQEIGRLPQDIHCVLISPPKEINDLILSIRNEASNEVTPSK